MQVEPHQAWKNGGRATAAGGMLMVAFWSLYFTANDAIGLVDPAHIQFEESFVAADAVLAILLFTTSWRLHRKRAEGPLLLVAAASMTLYLGILDTTYYARSGLFASLTTDAVLQGLINVVLISGGVFGLRCGRTMWRTQ